MKRLLMSLLAGIVVLAGSERLDAEPVDLTWDDLLPSGAAPFALSRKPGAGPQGLRPHEDDSGLDDPLFAQSPVFPAGVVEDLDGAEVRLPGFIVPLVVDDVGNVVEFFLVPYFGACIHVPPPPPNQIVHVTPDEAFPLHSMWEPFWIEGTMSTELHATQVGVSGYTLQAAKIEVYEE